jgi:hypothetical protein
VMRKYTEFMVTFDLLYSDFKTYGSHSKNIDEVIHSKDHARAFLSFQNTKVRLLFIFVEVL